jgi:hypothetical protein
MGQTTTRLPDPIQKRLAGEARRRGYTSASALIRAAIANELEGREAALDATEQPNHRNTRTASKRTPTREHSPACSVCSYRFARLFKLIISPEFGDRMNLWWRIPQLPQIVGVLKFEITIRLRHDFWNFPHRWNDRFSIQET